MVSPCITLVKKISKFKGFIFSLNNSSCVLSTTGFIYLNIANLNILKFELNVLRL